MSRVPPFPVPRKPAREIVKLGAGRPIEKSQSGRLMYSSWLAWVTRSCAGKGGRC